MRRSVLRSLGAAGVLIATAQGARAQLAGQIGDLVTQGVPVVGADVGVTIPISRFQDSAHVGGSLAPFVGYQMGDSFTVTPLLQPQFAAFAGCCNEAITSVTSLTAGARFSLNDQNTEVYFGAQGGPYWGTNGPVEHRSAGGFNIEGGLNYEFWRGTAVGVFGRYDNAYFRPAPNSSSTTTEFLSTGFEVRHRFLPPPPPPPPPAVAQAPPPPPPVKKKIVLRGVNFDFDKYTIRPDAAPILDEAARTLKEYGDVTVLVAGFTDSIGSEEYNLRLSVRRAQAVKDYLERQGIAASRMTVKGFGKSNPVASNATPEGRAQNRRVELIVNE
jgi:outer membrane protein OmpA-like peptidoglycan-associated protein